MLMVMSNEFLLYKLFIRYKNNSLNLALLFIDLINIIIHLTVYYP